MERRSARIQDVKWQPPGAETVWFEIHINPLIDADNDLRGVSVVFFDVTATRALLDKVVQTNRQLETAYEELQSTNEELETTNEELQSSVEELETTNEELQSTNEELETMNEELQSTNEELQTVNDELHERSLELDDARTFLDSLLVSSVRWEWSWWIGKCGWRCGTGPAKNSGGCGRHERPGRVLPRWTSDCRWRQCAR